ncbi:MAG: hypothetical protein Q9212_002845 [Teloschistes hypoglaucus]
MDATIAWERGSIKSTIRGAGFDSQIFTITVGPEGKALTAHAAYLSQSPVFERMCNSPFRESGTSTINLPEDEVKVIQAIIQYLYAGDFWGFGSAATLKATEGIGKDVTVRASSCEKLAAAEDLATMYITADKYQIQDLNSLAITKLAAVIKCKERPVEFLKIALRIYDSVPDSDQAYRSFFKSSFGTTSNIEPKSKELRSLIKDCIYGGGMLALDIVEIREAELKAEKKKKKKSKMDNDALAQRRITARELYEIAASVGRVN